MSRLPEPIKRRIVEHLACYRSHVEVAKLIAAEFEVTLTVRHIRAYDPTSFQFAASQRRRDYYRQVRARCANKLAEVAIAHRAYQLTQLQQLLQEAMDQGNFRQAQVLLKTAAKIMPR